MILLDNTICIYHSIINGRTIAMFTKSRNLPALVCSGIKQHLAFALQAIFLNVSSGFKLMKMEGDLTIGHSCFHLHKVISLISLMGDYVMREGKRKD